MIQFLWVIFFAVLKSIMLTLWETAKAVAPKILVRPALNGAKQGHFLSSRVFRVFSPYSFDHSESCTTWSPRRTALHCDWKPGAPDNQHCVCSHHVAWRTRSSDAAHTTTALYCRYDFVVTLMMLKYWTMVLISRHHVVICGLQNVSEPDLII